MTKTRRRKDRVISRRRHHIPTPRPEDPAPAPRATPGAPPRAIRSDIDGLSTVLDALGQRQFDLYDVSHAQWRAMSPRQQAALVNHQNRRAAADHSLGPTYLGSPALEQAVSRAHAFYIAMTPEQRRTVLHPRHLDSWIADRKVLTIVARDLERDDPLPDDLLPKSYTVADEGPSPDWPRPVQLTVAVSLDAPLHRVVRELENLIEGLHAPAGRRPRRRSATRPSREKYEDEEIAHMIGWYYRRAAGEPLKQLASAAAGPTARHVAGAQTKILRQLRWFRRELGIA